MDHKIAQRMRLLDKLKENTTEAAKDLLLNITPGGKEIKTKMKALKDQDDIARSKAQEAKLHLKNANKYLNQQKYMQFFSAINSFYTIAKDIKTELDKITQIDFPVRYLPMNHDMSEDAVKEIDKTVSEFSNADDIETLNELSNAEDNEEFNTNNIAEIFQQASRYHNNELLKQSGLFDWIKHRRLMNVLENIHGNKISILKDNSKSILSSAEDLFEDLKTQLDIMSEARVSKKIVNYKAAIEKYKAKFEDFADGYKTYYHDTMKDYIDSYKKEKAEDDEIKPIKEALKHISDINSQKKKLFNEYKDLIYKETDITSENLKDTIFKLIYEVKGAKILFTFPDSFEEWKDYYLKVTNKSNETKCKTIEDKNIVLRFSQYLKSVFNYVDGWEKNAEVLPKSRVFQLEDASHFNFVVRPRNDDSDKYSQSNENTTNNTYNNSTEYTSQPEQDNTSSEKSEYTEDTKTEQEQTKEQQSQENKQENKEEPINTSEDIEKELNKIEKDVAQQANKIAPEEAKKSHKEKAEKIKFKEQKIKDIENKCKTITNDKINDLKTKVPETAVNSVISEIIKEDENSNLPEMKQSINQKLENLPLDQTQKEVVKTTLNDVSEIINATKKEVEVLNQEKDLLLQELSIELPTNDTVQEIKEQEKVQEQPKKEFKSIHIGNMTFDKPLTSKDIETLQIASPILNRPNDKNLDRNIELYKDNIRKSLKQKMENKTISLEELQKILMSKKGPANFKHTFEAIYDAASEILSTYKDIDYMHDPIEKRIQDVRDITESKILQLFTSPRYYELQADDYVRRIIEKLIRKFVQDQKSKEQNKEANQIFLNTLKYLVANNYPTNKIVSYILKQSEKMESYDQQGSDRLLKIAENLIKSKHTL